jgi:predicted Ser/Thr protein kinase
MFKKNQSRVIFVCTQKNNRMALRSQRRRDTRERTFNTEGRIEHRTKNK